nr:MAG TPA: hypothetical protein [Herelleviridae sp.]
MPIVIPLYTFKYIIVSEKKLKFTTTRSVHKSQCQ